MKICINCFVDEEIRSRIRSHKTKGKCDCCYKSTYIYDTKKDNYLDGVFDKIIDLYKPSKNVTLKSKMISQTFLKNEIADVWNIFNNNVDPKNIQKIVMELSSEAYRYNPMIFNEPVIGIKEIDLQDNRKYLIVSDNNWNKFVNNLKYKNRFHNKGFSKDIFIKLLTYKCARYDKGSIFYRGRKSNNKELKANDLLAPPKKVTIDGRANSKGIKRLYLSTERETVIKELKPTINDYVYIGKFELKKDIIVVDLTKLNLFSPFLDDEIVKTYYLNTDTLNNIKRDMEKSVPNDGDSLDYVPTQFISDLIYSEMQENKWYGIKYNSTVCNNGNNVVLFDTQLCNCISVEKVRITDLSYIDK